MQRYSFLYTIVLIELFENHAFTEAKSGSIELDNYNFDKVTKKFQASLIKFDISYPFGAKHEAFMAFAKDTIEEEDLLVAQVLEDKSNVVLASKYGASKDKLPVVKLLVKGKSEPIPFNMDAEGFTVEELRRFVSENSGLYLSLPGCVKEFDKLTIQFMKGKKDERQKVLKKIEQHLMRMDKESTTGKIYETIMKKVLEKGDDFIQSELDRMKKLLSGKISDEKKKQLGIRINILQTFQSFHEPGGNVKEDL
ncbi:hypothetical protein PYW08_008061 [Mythimna loreyi]|uniref:Uncharacterized protein n=1 Tax=Mythimna loreyi TaxID=667449 RepID=A0ACC2QAT0_9NEOP|nr:hypothetical protein PYW08_008061 [Mythimna loreyi]